jgi:cell division septal protein FtsQ
MMRQFILLLLLLLLLLLVLVLLVLYRLTGIFEVRTVSFYGLED